MVEVDDWEGLADWLDISSAYIREDCAPAPKPQCFRKKLVNIYRDRLGADDKCMVVLNIADALEKMKRKRTAQILRQLYSEL